MKLRQLFALAALMLGLLQGAGATPFTFTFDTVPSGGAVGGQPGQLVGWGYQLTNTDTSNWLVLTQLSASSISLGTPDASYFDFPILAPGAAASVGFDPGTLSGLYGLQLFSLALPGQTDSGEFTLAGEWWSGDPFAGGTLIRAADALSAPFGVSVVAAQAIPLPGSLLLLAGGLPLLWLGQRRRQPGAQLGLGLG